MLKLGFLSLSGTLLPLLTVMATFARADGIQPPNFHVVSKGVLRGANPIDTESMGYLKGMGVKTIVSLQGGDSLLKIMETERLSGLNREHAQALALGMQFYNVPVPGLRSPTDGEVRMILQLISLMRNPRYQPIYIHCERGTERTGFVIALHRVLNQGWLPQHAYAEMVASGYRGIPALATRSLKHLFFQLTDPNADEMADVPFVRTGPMWQTGSDLSHHPGASAN